MGYKRDYTIPNYILSRDYTHERFKNTINFYKDCHINTVHIYKLSQSMVILHNYQVTKTKNIYVAYTVYEGEILRVTIIPKNWVGKYLKELTQGR